LNKISKNKSKFANLSPFFRWKRINKRELRFAFTCKNSRPRRNTRFRFPVHMTNWCHPQNTWKISTMQAYRLAYIFCVRSFDYRMAVIRCKRSSNRVRTVSVSLLTQSTIKWKISLRLKSALYSLHGVDFYSPFYIKGKKFRSRISKFKYNIHVHVKNDTD